MTSTHIKYCRQDSFSSPRTKDDTALITTIDVVYPTLTRTDDHISTQNSGVSSSYLPCSVNPASSWRNHGNTSLHLHPRPSEPRNDKKSVTANTSLTTMSTVETQPRGMTSQQRCDNGYSVDEDLYHSSVNHWSSESLLIAFWFNPRPLSAILTVNCWSTINYLGRWNNRCWHQLWQQISA